MSDIAPRPCSIAPGFEHDWIKSADGSVVSVENQPHVVACVNAIHAAGVTPEALARDPECLRKLVTAARAACHGLGTNEVGEALRTCGIEVNQ